MYYCALVTVALDKVAGVGVIGTLGAFLLFGVYTGTRINVTLLSV